MNYSQFLEMMPEALLVLALVVVFFADFCFARNERKNDYLGKLTSLLLVGMFIPTFLAEPTEAFGGMYVTSEMVNVMKFILTFGTLIVVIMAQPWVEKTQKLAGEFYMLVLSTLLGMYVMMSSAHFLLFFLGLEMASVPMACLVAFDKWKKDSAEAAAKYILTATFSSGVMLYGISFVYAATGTLYFGDVAAALAARFAEAGSLQVVALPVLGMVFFFSGLGFKISLVPFHLPCQSLCPAFSPVSFPSWTICGVLPLSVDKC